MCGINGFNWCDKNLIKKMNRIISHRGDNSSGTYLGDFVSLGHQRLSIIDLSTRAKQPMTNEDYSIWIVFNGEIYNFNLIRRELEKKGHEFKTTSDTEVIIHAYEEYGPNCVKKLDGMWAFAILDTINKTLFLSRDRMGQKPVYYYVNGDKFMFSSQPKTFTALSNFKKKLSDIGMVYYVAYGFIPSPYSIYENVYKVEAAHNLIYDLRKKEITAYYCYDELLPLFAKKMSKTREEYLKDVDSLLFKGVKKRLVADVPIGIFVSGGIDSSLITCYVKKLENTINTKIHTFSLGFENMNSDESEYSWAIAKNLNTKHHFKIMTKEDALKEIPRSVEYYDEPLADSSTYTVLYISKLARKHVKVAITGDGGDEVFWGYHHYTKMPLYELLRKTFLPRFFLDRDNVFWNSSTNKMLFRISRCLNLLNTSNVSELYAQYHSVFKRGETKELLKHNKQQRKLVQKVAMHYTNFFRTKDLHDNMCYSDLKNILGELFFAKVDRGSMSTGLEIRSPLIDSQLIRYVIRIPKRFKLNPPKSFLKELLKQKTKVSDDFINRKKRGFGFPLEELFTPEIIDSYLPKTSKVYDVINRRYITKLITQIKHGINRYRQIHSIINLNLWMEKWL